MIHYVQQLVDLFHCFIVYCTLHAMLGKMAVSFGDFKPDEIYNLIQNKDPLGLNNDIQGHLNTNNQQLSQKDKEYDSIVHYIKMASTLKTSNVNNNADSNPESEDTITKDTIPSQVNYPSTSRNYPSTSKNTPYSM